MNKAISTAKAFWISLSIVLAGHFSAEAAETTAQASAAAASTGARQWLQHGRTWLAQNKYEEAIKCFDQAVSSSSDPDVSSEARRLVADTYTAWAQSLQVTRYRISGEIAPAQERLAQIQQEVDQAKQGLADLAAQLKQQQSSRGKIRVDPVAQGNRNTYELTVLKGTTAINKQTRNIASLREQLNTLEVDISRIQSRMPTPTILRVTQARCGSKDVTRAAQDLVRGDRATIRASADSFGLRQDQFPDAALKISYELRGEKKEVSVPQGWTVKLPSAELIAPPPQAPEPPWYEKHAMWLAGGVLALLLIITTFWQPKSKKPEL